jgi:hypothetical protein
MDDHVLEYPYCPIRSRVQRLADHVPVLRPVAAALWPAARRADTVRLNAAGLTARSLAGVSEIAWPDVAAVRRARTTWGRMTMHVVARDGRQIEVAETLPGFTELVRVVHQATGLGQVVPLRPYQPLRRAA